MSAPLAEAGGLAYRVAETEQEPSGDSVLLLHGFPESSYMWRELMPAIAAAGHQAIAPDLPGFGDSPPLQPNSWESLVEAINGFVAELQLGPVILLCHDWGGLVGLRWACDHPGAASALVISSTGFFSDGQWHGMAQALRTPGTGEELLESLTREGFGAVMGAASTNFTSDAVDEYWRAASTPARRGAVLDLYRSGDFEKLAPYEGRLAELRLPTLILWGENDEFAPISGAKRFQSQIEESELAAIEGAGHFVYADAPQRCAEVVERFLATLPKERGGGPQGR